jgi:hypothetical protein
MGKCIVSISNKIQRHTVYLYLETTLHVSGGTYTHRQKRIQLYLQHHYILFSLCSLRILQKLKTVHVLKTQQINDHPMALFRNKNYCLLFHHLVFLIILYTVVCFVYFDYFCKLCIFIVMFMYSYCYVYSVLYILFCIFCSVYSVLYILFLSCQLAFFGYPD